MGSQVQPTRKTSAGPLRELQNQSSSRVGAGRESERIHDAACSPSSMPRCGGWASRRIDYRGYRVTVTTVRRRVGVTALASLSGGPDSILRSFFVPCCENEVTLACVTVCDELLRIIDDLGDG